MVLLYRSLVGGLADSLRATMVGVPIGVHGPEQASKAFANGHGSLSSRRGNPIPGLTRAEFSTTGQGRPLPSSGDSCSLWGLMALPLTRQLTTETPLRRWFVSRLGNVDALNARSPTRIRCVVSRRRPDAIPPWLMGMAFDWRLRLGLEVPADVGTTTAFAGWILAFGQASSDPHAPSDDPVTALFDRAIRHGAGGGSAVRDELELARISVALALYESWYRGGVRRDGSLFALGAAPDPAALTSLCPLPAAEELARLVDLARRGLASLFPASEIETNPVFDAHGIPADGDLLIDGLLLDLKTVSNPRIQAEWVWQTIGYVLLDGGRRDIESVGLYFSRHGRLLRWSVHQLLSELACREVTLGDVREDFLRVVSPVSSAHQAAERQAAGWDFLVSRRARR